ncbi:hypothetical protein HNR02_000001, partial [Amycolatopsis endophytica]|nr:hypothetical protein [Amycolatopsis endophytica]
MGDRHRRGHAGVPAAQPRLWDRDSLGLFQQRPSQGWGTPAQILNPSYAATQFYEHLLAVPNWQQMSVTGAAQ